MGMVRFDSDALSIESPLQIAALKNGGKAYANRDYTWIDVIPEIDGRTYLQTSGGVARDIVVRAKRDIKLEILIGGELSNSDAVKKNDVAARYTDSSKTPLTLYEKTLKAGDVWVVPFMTWTGTLVLLPE